jgi:hypothetical protein
MRSSAFLLALLLLAPAACTEMNPDTRSGIWHPTGVNARNLTAMMANPADAIEGRGAQGTDSPLAITAVERLMAGKPKPLPETPSQAIMNGSPTNAAAGGS